MTGATGDLTPDEIQADLETGEWREAVDPVHHGDVTEAQVVRAPAQSGEIGEPGADLPDGGPTNMATRESGYGSEHGLSPNDSAYRMELHTKERPAEIDETKPREDREPRMGGDVVTDHEEHL
ncbi:MAG: hypothetical protein M3Y29_08720 [Chloroflexota bacterium]|nr:hypothetical protein [Chloroflexota bacterium]